MGTFVRGPEPGVEPGARGGGGSRGHRPQQEPAGPGSAVGLGRRDILQALARRPDLDRLMDFYQPAPGMARHREAGRALDEPHRSRGAARSGDHHQRRPARGRHGARLARPSGRSDPHRARHLHRHEGDREPAASPAPRPAARWRRPHSRRPSRPPAGTRSPRALYCMPTLHNPTARTMPLGRRQAIVEIAARYDVALIEDDVYGFLPDQPLPPLTATCRRPTAYYITSTSKSLAPGLRVGYVAAPESRVDRVGGGHPGEHLAHRAAAGGAGERLDRAGRSGRDGGVEAGGDRRPGMRRPSGSSGRWLPARLAAEASISGFRFPSRGAPRSS